MDDVDGRVQGQDHQQQDESRRVGFLRLIEVPGGGGLVDEVGQGGAGAAQVVEREADPFDRGEVLGGAEEDDDDRGVADDPAEAEHRPGGHLRSAGRQQDPPRRRRLGLADRVGGLAHVPRNRVQPLADAGDDQRQRHQREHRPGSEEGAAEDDSFGAAAGEAEGGAGEDHRAEEGEDDRGNAGDRLDRRFGDAGERRRAPVLDQPDRDRDPGGQRHGDPHQSDDHRPEEGVGEATGFGLAEAGGGRGPEHLRAQELDPLDQQVGDDRDGGRAEEQAERPADAEADAVDQAPGGGALDRALVAAPVLRRLRRRGGQRGRRGGGLHRGFHQGAPYL